jgi:hypothetical protein
VYTSGSPSGTGLVTWSVCENDDCVSLSDFESPVAYGDPAQARITEFRRNQYREIQGTTYRMQKETPWRHSRLKAAQVFVCVRGVVVCMLCVCGRVADSHLTCFSARKNNWRIRRPLRQPFALKSKEPKWLHMRPNTLSTPSWCCNYLHYVLRVWGTKDVEAEEEGMIGKNFECTEVTLRKLYTIDLFHELQNNKT